MLAGSTLANEPATSSRGGETLRRARYLVLTTQQGTPSPVAAVDFVCGPTEGVRGARQYWWQLELRGQAEQSARPLCVLRALTTANPLATREARLGFARYIVRFPEVGETIEYRDRHSGRALRPAWQDFERHFVPHPVASSRRREGFPETCDFLGHVLTLVHVGNAEVWEPWADAQVLVLDRELLVGTGRNFKDQEGRRLPQQPQPQNYTYIPFTESDYAVMFDAGMNLFTVSPAQEALVRTRPVFYLRGAGGQPPLRYPADLYRANHLGPVMFMDEPSILMVGDKLVHDTLRHFSDAAALIEQRTRATYLSDGSYGAFHLEKSLRNQGANLGTMRLMQPDVPSWETMFETTFYQMRGGGSGLVHEGRYQLPEFDRAIARFTGHERKHTARELLLYHYAFLRGGTRPFGKHWGTAIYGQCDTNIAALAVTLAYDQGARYVWFWTFDHDHHVPWPEQLTLARTLKEHAQSHPRPSIFGPAPKRDTAIVIPDGYFLSLENLWWVRAMDKEGTNAASSAYQRLMRRGIKAVHRCLDRGEDFDVTVDDGRPIRGYRHIVRVDDRE